MTDFDSIAPTAGDVGNTFEWIYDICADPTNPAWLNVPDITGLTPNATPKLKDVTTYANKGQTAQRKTGEDFALSVQVKGVRDETGEFQPELLVLINAADAVGDDNVIGYRYYHATSGVLAYQGTAAVQWSRANTGNDDPEFFQFELTGQGDRKKIPNPALGPAVPVITAVNPSGAAATDTIYVEGTKFTGATAVTIGGVAATSFQVIHDQLLTAVVPAGAAGSAPIVVTNAAGASEPFAYERG